MDDLVPNVAAIRWRLAEAIEWCARLGPISDPGTAASQLRTPKLCPTDFTYSKNRHGYDHMTPALGGLALGKLSNLVEDVAQLRVDQLKLSNGYPLAPAQDLAGGRLLFYDPHDNLSEGSEAQVTKGYFDVDAVPPWDTWLWFITQQTRLQNRPYGQEFWYDRYLISWVPPDLVDIVDAGLRTSTTFCLAWAEDLDSELLGQLTEARIIAQ